MATSRSTPYLLEPVTPAEAEKPASAQAWLIISALTIAAATIHGYHPYAEDGGVYLSGVEHLLNPALFPAWAEFVQAHLQFSLFAPIMALLARITGVGLMGLMCVVYITTLWTTLFGAWLVAERCFQSIEACCGSVALLAVWLTLPIAGTSLILLDPYVSARSFSTPCGLLALAGAIDLLKAVKQQQPIRRHAAWLFGAGLSVAGIMHPLMAGYVLALIFFLACTTLSLPDSRLYAAIVLGVGAVILAICLTHLPSPHPSGYAQVAQTRTYWFIREWHWYEQLGVIAPLAILSHTAFKSKGSSRTIIGSLSQAGFFAGCTALTISLLGAQVASPNYLTAMLQPLRMFQQVYIVMILALGAELGKKVLKHRPLRWLAVFPVLAAISWFAQIKTFPSSAHFEFPWTTPSNGWEQGFLWIRINTPKDALFALDAHYIDAPGEDSHNFRAVAERSVLPDYSKDGGITAITPRLTGEWAEGERAQLNLDSASDEERLAHLKSFHPAWIVLSEAAQTHLECVYQNRTMKVCRIPWRLSADDGSTLTSSR